MSPLIYIVLLPLIAAVVIALTPARMASVIRGIAIAATFAAMVIGIEVFIGYDGAEVGEGGYRFLFSKPWVPDLGINFLLGVDGINLGLVVMATIVGFAATCLSSEIQKRQKQFYFLMMLMVGGVIGAFASLDLFFFYFFHELALVPTFIMIGVWGRGENRRYAAFKITMYLTVGALLALIGLIAVYVQSGAGTFSIIGLVEHARSNPISSSAQNLIFPFLLFGFGILVSLFPFHTWAPMGYAAAPSATAMLHAGVLKKFGLYGLIRVALPLLPEATHAWVNVIAWLCIGNILYVGLVALRQKDLNLLIGNSSVAHMGFVFLGVASLSLIGVTGAVLVMVAHGLLAALSFGLSGYIHQQNGSLEMAKMGGLLKRMPFVGSALLMAMLAGCGVPGFANFAGEVLVLFGSWAALPGFVIATAWGALIVGGVYMMRGIRAVLHGAPADDGKTFADASTIGARFPFVILLTSLLLLGCFPGLLTSKIEPSAKEVLSFVAPVDEGAEAVAQTETTDQTH